MDTIRELLKKPWVKTALVGLAGVLFGLIVLGWWLVPVKWTDATPAFLREDAKKDYIRMVVESYSINKDTALAKNRWESLGKDAVNLYKEVQPSLSKLPAADLVEFSRIVNAPLTVDSNNSQPVTTGSGGETSTSSTTGSSTTADSKAGKSNGILPFIFALFCVLSLVLGFIIFYVFLKRGKRAQSTSQGPVKAETPGADYFKPKSSEHAPGWGGAPISQFMTTYMQGDDQYDDTFTIDNAMGEFLGECGVGISETIGVGDPKKVTAFDIWLFDKNDIQTVTKVIMSRHTYDDPSAHQNAMTKGEPLLAEPGQSIFLETATLQLEARIVDMNYGQSPLPENSYFDRMTVELSLWQK